MGHLVGDEATTRYEVYLIAELEIAAVLLLFADEQNSGAYSPNRNLRGLSTNNVSTSA